MINVLSKVTLLNVNSTCPPPCLILYQHYVHNISTLPNTLPQYPASRGAPHNKFVTFYISMPTRHIGTDVIHHTLLNVAFGGEWSTSPSGRCVPGGAFRHPLSRIRDGPQTMWTIRRREKVAIRRDSNPESFSP